MTKIKHFSEGNSSKYDCDGCYFNIHNLKFTICYFNKNYLVIYAKTNCNCFFHCIVDDNFVKSLFDNRNEKGKWQIFISPKFDDNLMQYYKISVDSLKVCQAFFKTDLYLYYALSKDHKFALYENVGTCDMLRVKMTYSFMKYYKKRCNALGLIL